MEQPSDADVPRVSRLQDKNGKTYTLHFYESEIRWVFKTFDGRVLVAEAKCLVQGDGLFIGDLHVFAHVSVPGTLLGSMLRSALNLRFPKKNYRGMGLGTQLLEIVVEHAKQHKLSRVFGNLCARDLGSNPRLANWYEGRGFTVEMHQNRNSGTISRYLQ